MLRPHGKSNLMTVYMSGINQRDSRLTQAEHQNIEMQKALLAEYFQHAGWECDRIIKGIMTTTDFYYHQMGQVKMDQWSRGRVVLLADAG